MESNFIILSLLFILILSIFVIVYLIKTRKNDTDNNFSSDLQNLKESINTHFSNQNNSVSSQLNSISSSFNNLSKDVTRDTTQTLTKFDEKVRALNQQVESLSQGQKDFTKVLSGVKRYGTLAEYSLGALIRDLLPATQYIANAQMRPEEDGSKVEFAVKLQNDVLCPIDSHWPIEKLKAVEDAYNQNDKKLLAEARKKLASAIKKKANDILDLYIAPPKTTNFGILYLPTEGLYSELTSYRDPNTKILLIEELRKNYKITLAGPNVLCSMIQAFHLGFQTLKIQKHAKQIYIDLTKISSRFEKHFMGVTQLRTLLQDALDEVDNFGKDARSIKNTLENIKDPDNVKESLQENPEKVKVIK